MWKHVFPFWLPPSWISEWYRRMLSLTKTSLSSLHKRPDIQRYFIQPYNVYQGCLLRATILLILDEFHKSKLLIWRHAYWGHVMLRSLNRCCPVDNVFVHKVIKYFCQIFSDKKLHSKECSGGIPPLFATQGLSHLHCAISPRRRCSSRYRLSTAGTLSCGSSTGCRFVRLLCSVAMLIAWLAVVNH